MPLTIVARLTAKPGKAPELEALLLSLIPTTKAEDGCLTYELHRSNDDPNLFHFHESWASQEQWEAHMDAPHLQDFSSKSEHLVDDWKLFQMTQIG